MLGNTQARYGWVSIILHWGLALAILTMFALGVWMVELDYYSPWYHPAPAWHKAAGVLIVGLMVLRWLWLVLNPRVVPLVHTRWELTLAKAVHGALYVAVVALGASGYLIATAEGQAVDVFGVLSVPAWQSEALFENQTDLAGELHAYIAYGLMGLVGLHLAGALKHHLLDKDATLRRMLGFKS